MPNPDSSRSPCLSGLGSVIMRSFERARKKLSWQSGQVFCLLAQVWQPWLKKVAFVQAFVLPLSIVLPAKTTKLATVSAFNTGSTCVSVNLFKLNFPDYQQ